MSIRYEIIILMSKRIYILNIEFTSEDNITCGLVTDFWCGRIGYRLVRENVGCTASFLKASIVAEDLV